MIPVPFIRSLIFTASLFVHTKWQQTTISDVDACVLAVGAKGMRSIVAGNAYTTSTSMLSQHSVAGSGNSAASAPKQLLLRSPLSFAK
jgi:hypothetical protein